MTSDARLIYVEAPGWYAVRQAKGAVEVGCRVSHGPVIDPVTGEEMDRGMRWHVEIDGRTVHYGPAPHKTLLLGRPITRVQYEELLADRAWAREHAPDSPKAKPWARVDVKSIPLPF